METAVDFIDGDLQIDTLVEEIQQNGACWNFYSYVVVLLAVLTPFL